MTKEDDCPSLSICSPGIYAWSPKQLLKHPFAEGSRDDLARAADEATLPLLRRQPVHEADRQDPAVVQS